jgi:hypothetical protein
MTTEGTGGNNPPIESNVDITSLLSNQQLPTNPTNPEPVLPGLTQPVLPDVVNNTTPTITEPLGVFDQTLVDFKRTDLSEEEKSAQGELLSFFKATNVDDKGNLLNENGQVVLTTEALKNYLDNDDLLISENGDVVNSLGEVIQTKADLLNTYSVVTPVKSAIETNFGVKFEGTQDFPDTTEGIIDLVQESLKQLNKNTVLNFLEAQPEVKGFVQHLALGGTVDTYKSSNIDYKGVDVKTLDDTSKLEFLKRSFTLQGTPNPEGLIDLIKKAGEEEINKATKGALDFLDAKQVEQNANRDAQLQQQYQQQEQDITNYWKNVETVVSKGNLNHINIPVQERAGFFDYLSKPINDKMESAEALDLEKETIETQLLISYLRYKKGDLSQLVNNIAKEQKVLTLSERMHKQRATNNGNGVPITKGSNNKTSSVSLEALLG